MKYLPGRSRQAIHTRWNLHLSKHYSSDITTVRTSKKWTPEEDAILIREYDNNPRAYVDEAMSINLAEVDKLFSFVGMFT